MQTGVSEGGLVHDVGCEGLHCTICNFTTMPRMTLRGICPNLEIDTNYILSLNQYHEGFLIFIGSSIFEIRFSKEGKAWQLVDITKEGVIAQTETSPDYPIGIHRWIFTNNTCADKGNENKRMNFHSCSLDEFPCENGECIDMAKRCNRRDECKDHIHCIEI